MDNHYKACYKPEPSYGRTKPLAQRQLTTAPAPRHATGKQEETRHVNHSFQWCGRDKIQTSLTCSKSGSIEDSLRTSAQFKQLLGKNQNKELVIVLDGRALSSHFPCSLIKDELLYVVFIKSSDQPQLENRALASRKRFPTSEPVIFHVSTRGGDNVAKILKNRGLGKKFEEISIYAYKGEKVKDALRRDNRLLDVVFKKSCGLVQKGTGVRTEMLDLVDNLDGKTFKIERISRAPPPASPPESLDDDYVSQNESQGSGCEESCHPPQQSVSTESVTDDIKQKTKQSCNIQPSVVPNSKKVRCNLTSGVTDFLKGLTGVNVQKLFREQFGKNAEACNEVRTMKKLMELSDSVCQIRINGRPKGSGFLLFGNFVLTNAHVVKDVYDVSTGHLNEQMAVHFSYTSQDQVDPGVQVEEVTGLEYCHDASGHMYDWALLKLSVDLDLPRPLLTHFGFLPPGGGICIIGHPDGGVKKHDTCWIIPTNKRREVTDRHNNENPDGVLLENADYSENQGHITLVTPQYFKDLANSIQRKESLLMYESCFYFGSSGSPVFDEYCNVVAMHSGGFVYKHRHSGRKNSVIEFGYPLSFILEHIIIKMVERKRFDVLKEFLACSFSRHLIMMTNIKRLIESRNLTSFQEAFTGALRTGDESLRAFFEFLCQKEESVPMDIN